MEIDDLMCCANCKKYFTNDCPFIKDYMFNGGPEMICHDWLWDLVIAENREVVE